MKQNTRQLALSSVLAALAVVFLCMGGLLPLALYACPLLSSLLLIPLMEECSSRLCWTWYAAVSILGLLLGNDKEAILLFVFLGYYPLLQPKLQHLPSRAVRFIAKFCFFCVSVGGMYAIMLWVFRISAAMEELQSTAPWLLALTAGLGLLLFFIYDQILLRFHLLYRKKRKKAKNS